MINLNFQPSSNSYTDLFFVYLFVLSLLFFFTIDWKTEAQNFGHLIEVSFGVVLLYTLVIIILKPYQDNLNRISIILCELVKLLFLVFLFLVQKQVVSQILQLIAIYFFLFSILCLCILNAIRIKKTWIIPKSEE